MFCGCMYVWMDEYMNGSLDGWCTSHIVDQEAIRVRNRSQTLRASSGLDGALSKKTVLAQKTVPTPYCLAQFRILHATASHSRRMSSVACHSFQCSNDFFSYSLLKCSRTFPAEFRFPCYRLLQNFFFLVHATVSHTLLCISRMWESLFALFFG